MEIDVNSTKILLLFVSKFGKGVKLEENPLPCVSHSLHVYVRVKIVTENQY